MRIQSRLTLTNLSVLLAVGVAWAALPGCGDDTPSETTASATSSGAGGDSAASTSSSASTGSSASSGGGGAGGEGGGSAEASIRFIGRFDTSDPAGPRFGWPGSAIVTRFSGTSVSVRLKDTSPADAPNFFQVILDGKDKGVLGVSSQAELFKVAEGLPDGSHDLLLHRRTEGFVGVTQFLELVLDPGKDLLPTSPAPARRIEVIGDSISAGYGVDGPNEQCHFTSATENNYLAYGPQAARLLGADAHIIAWSGIGAYQNNGGGKDNTMPDVYGRTIPGEPAPAWDFASWVPHVVVVNLGTNDFSMTDPGEPQFTEAYGKLVQTVRTHYADAYIFCAVGPMLSDYYPQGVQALTKARAYIHKVVDERTAMGDERMRYIEFPTQDPANGLGCDYHPSVKTNQLMAEQLAAAIKKDLGW